MPNKYKSNVENILRATIDGTEDYNKPLSNVEKLLVELKDVIETGGGGLFAKAISLTINDSTYVVTAQLLDQNGDALGAAQSIDLPLESMVVSGSYDNTTKKVILTLKNGNTVEFSVADLVSGLVTDGYDHITLGNGKTLYISDTAPTGARTGDLWIGG